MITRVFSSVLLLYVVQGSPNLAIGKAAYQSSTIQGAEASRAIDGNNATSLSEGSCSMTNNGTLESWELDLGRHYTVHRIKIITSTDAIAIPALYMEIVSPTIGEPKLFYSHDSPISPGTVLDIVKPEGVRGRTVYMDKQGELGPLTLCEVEVYGTSEWFFRRDMKRGASDEVFRVRTGSKTGCAQYCASNNCQSFLWNPANKDCVVYNDLPTDTSPPPDNLLGFVAV